MIGNIDIFWFRIVLCKNKMILEAIIIISKAAIKTQFLFFQIDEY